MKALLNGSPRSSNVSPRAVADRQPQELAIGYATLKRLIPLVLQPSTCSTPSTTRSLPPSQADRMRNLTDRIAEHQTLTFSLDDDKPPEYRRLRKDSI